MIDGPREINTERSHDEEQVLTPEKKHEGTDVLIADKALPLCSRFHSAGAQAVNVLARQRPSFQGKGRLAEPSNFRGAATPNVPLRVNKREKLGHGPLE